MNSMKIAALAVLIFASITAAHLEGEGKTFGDYKFEFSTLPENLMVDKNSDMVITVENASTGERLTGVNVFVKVSKDGRAVFSMPSAATDKFGVVTLNYIFSEGGEYVLDIAVRDTGSSAKFDFGVAGGYVPLYTAMTAAIFFIIGIVAGFIFSRRLGNVYKHGKRRK